MTEASKVQCADVRNPSARTFAHYPEEAAHSGAPYGFGGSLKALARKRLQENAERTKPRTLPRTLSETGPHITPEKDPLMCACQTACKGLRLKPAELAASLTSEDAEVIAQGPNGARILRAYAEAVADRKLRERGLVPAHYTARTHCKSCGLVPIFPEAPTYVDGCPWCWNRIRGLPMPRRTA